MKPNRGDIVLLDYPFSTGAGAKVRPGLVVQSDARNRLLNHTIVAMISSNITHATRDPTQLLIEVAAPEGQRTGLQRNSVVKCGNLFTVHEDLIRRKLGSLSASMMQQVDVCLKAALDVR